MYKSIKGLPEKEKIYDPIRDVTTQLSYKISRESDLIIVQAIKDGYNYISTYTTVLDPDLSVINMKVNYRTSMHPVNEPKGYTVNLMLIRETLEECGIDYMNMDNEVVISKIKEVYKDKGAE